MKQHELKEFLDEKVVLYNNPSFIVDDPVQIPHLYTQKEDIEIAGFLSATIAWGNRKMIIKNAHKMMELMGNSPYDFVMNHNEDHLDALEGFVHRTFNSIDLATFIQALQHIYLNHGGLEAVFSDSAFPLQERISKFKTIFFEIQHQSRTQKHISDPLKGSAAKRINMYLRWMVRNDNAGVDFGLWKGVSPSELSCPLDVHSGNMARKLGILKRTQNDAKALLELDTALRELDPLDPVKYDFALFGLGAIEKF
ncbi:TIGR02757 family protein [Myroides sp. C15-4]|uniref:TIGR02757 family protein n=1 Tax=Myroides sp. C15-4 TaxID=3400532 RepID=UPI003D2F9092